jgi:hypothetical protein
MDQKTERIVLRSKLTAYLAILKEKGIHFPLPPDDDLDKLSDSDLTDLVRSVRDLARTPTS